MAKKKSKTQKYKKNQKRKIQKIESKPIKKNTNNPPQKEKQLVDKNKITYNIALKEDSKKSQQKENNNLKTTKKLKSNTKKDILINKKDQNKKNNILKRLLFEIKNNTHIIFNALIIITFIIMLIGFFRIEVLETGTIIYICSIVIFLMAIAISYNKYVSGKVFTIILTLCMSLAIYQMQYTYDFIRNLNSNLYEYKTYYVVTFDNGSNRSIYNINNKKVGLLKDNSINIERILNTKLDNVNYMEYENINDLFEDFYNQKFRALLVNENQYKYLKNNIIDNSRNVKILYEFKANAKK